MPIPFVIFGAVALVQLFGSPPTGRDANGQTFPLPNASGVVALLCEASPTRRLEHCRITMETPAGLRLGYAALRMTEGQILDGRAVPAGLNGLYAVSVKFGGAKEQAGTTLAFAPLLAVPSVDEIRSAAALPGSEADGVASLSCKLATDGHLRSCAAASGASVSPEVLRAAMKLVPLFQVDMSFYAKAIRAAPSLDLQNASVPLAVNFSARLLHPGSPRYVRRLDWLATKAPDEPVVYPPRAKLAGVTSGAAKLDCVIVAGGRLQGCAVVKRGADRSGVRRSRHAAGQ